MTIPDTDGMSLSIIKPNALHFTSAGGAPSSGLVGTAAPSPNPLR